MKKEVVIILDNIRSAYNVGSIFRTADGAGVEKVYLLGYTPTPVDRFGREQPEIAKTSLGASEIIPSEHIKMENTEELIGSLKREGFQIVAIEQTSDSISLDDFTVPAKVCYILGNEIDGVSQELLTMADLAVEIPMLGQKESLNVSVAAGIALFHRGSSRA
ncbi:MAG: RNA methyltransferase [Candidatus Paceibacterota bacterium]